MTNRLRVTTASVLGVLFAMMLFSSGFGLPVILVGGIAVGKGADWVIRYSIDRTSGSADPLLQAFRERFSGEVWLLMRRSTRYLLACADNDPDRQDLVPWHRVSATMSHVVAGDPAWAPLLEPVTRQTGSEQSKQVARKALDTLISAEPEVLAAMRQRADDMPSLRWLPLSGRQLQQVILGIFVLSSLSLYSVEATKLPLAQVASGDAWTALLQVAPSLASRMITGYQAWHPGPWASLNWLICMAMAAVLFFLFRWASESKIPAHTIACGACLAALMSYGSLIHPGSARIASMGTMSPAEARANAKFCELMVDDLPQQDTNRTPTVVGGVALGVWRHLGCYTRS